MALSLLTWTLDRAGFVIEFAIWEALLLMQHLAAAMRGWSCCCIPRLCSNSREPLATRNIKRRQAV